MNISLSQNVSLLSDIEDFYNNGQFSSVANSSYDNFLLCLEKWIKNILLLNMFRWALLKNPPTWERILRSTKNISAVDKNIKKIEICINLFILQI
jgi:hypothetical protein